MRRFLFLFLPLLGCSSLFAQSYSLFGPAKFMTWNNQARSSGMGELGVVAPDGYAETAIWQNPALLGNHDDQQGGSLSFSPMLRALGIPDMNLFAGNYYRKFSPKTSLGIGLIYFTYGSFFPEDWWNGFEASNPEFQVKSSLSHQLSEHWTLGGGLGYVFSQRVRLLGVDDLIPYKTMTADIGIHYTQSRQVSENNLANFQWGISLMNMGQKGTYQESKPKEYFFPASLQSGFLWGLNRTTAKGNTWQFSVGGQLKKLLIPQNEEHQDLKALPGMAMSLFEAQNGNTPNSWEEWTKQMGFEAMYQGKLWRYGFRTGLWKEWGLSPYQTIGLSIGTHYIGKSWLQLDMAYYAPYQPNDPFQNTVKFTLSYVRGVE